MNSGVVVGDDLAGAAAAVTRAVIECYMRFQAAGDRLPDDAAASLIDKARRIKRYADACCQVIVGRVAKGGGNLLDLKGVNWPPIGDAFEQAYTATQLVVLMAPFAEHDDVMGIGMAEQCVRAWESVEAVSLLKIEWPPEPGDDLAPEEGEVTPPPETNGAAKVPDGEHARTHTAERAARRKK